MNANLFKAIILLTLATFLGACDGDDNDKEVRDLQSQVSDLVTQLNSADANRAELLSQIEDLNAQINERKALDLSILHINDHHSHLAAEQFSFDVSTLNLQARTEGDDALTEVDVEYGGFPLLVSLFKQLDTHYDNVVKIHAGDAITGTLFYTLFNGSADAAVMNQVCFDIFALGNHEFDDGDAGLARFLDDLNNSGCETATLAANVTPRPESAIAEGYIQPYTIKEFDGELVGFIGIDIAGKTMESSQPDVNTTFADETTTAQMYIDELENLGVNKIILVTHYQYENDLALAAALSGVDAIVGGDSHSLLGDESFEALGFNPVGDYPTHVTNIDGEPVCIVQAWEYAHLLGKLDISFDSEGLVTACGGSPLMPIKDNFNYAWSEEEHRSLNASDAFLIRQALTRHDEIVVVHEDASTASLLSLFEEETSVLTEAVIGSVTENLCLVRWPGDSRSNICDVSDTYSMGADISNIVAKAFLRITPTADIAIQNGGGVRIDIPAGDFTIGDAYTLLPFSNTLVTLNMTGQQIIDVLEDALANTLDNAGSTGSYPYASGLRFHVDASAAKGSRISNPEVNSQVAGDWAAIDAEASYVVVTNDYIASGRDGYDTFGIVFDAGEYVNTYTTYAQGMVDYVEALTEAGEYLTKLPTSEYSTQNYIGRDACNHGTQSDCSDY